MTGNGSPLDGIGRFSIVSLSFRVCAKANVGLMRAAPTPAASRKKLVRDKSLVSKDFELRRIVKRFLCTRSCCWDHDVLATAPAQWQHSQRAGGGNDLNDVRFSNRPSGVKRFQRYPPTTASMSRTGSHFSSDSAPRALPSWDSKTRWNNLSGGRAGNPASS